jgi:hypothetical protein
MRLDEDNAVFSATHLIVLCESFAVLVELDGWDE